MYKEKFHGFISWISTGGAATGLALFVFMPTVATRSELVQIIATCMAVASIPFLACSSALCREIKATNSSSKNTDKYLSILVATGGLLLVCSLGLIAFAYHLASGVVFLVALVSSTKLYKSGSVGNATP